MQLYLLVQLLLAGIIMAFVELNTRIAMRGCMLGDVEEVHRNYVAPISNTGAGTQLLLNK